MPRWTVRGVHPDAIRAVQRVQEETGASLGEIVGVCIEAGIGHAQHKFAEKSRGPSPEVTALQEAVQRAILAFEAR